jgi:O-antigen ligase
MTDGVVSTAPPLSFPSPRPRLDLVNFWLVLVLVVGATCVIADGLGRPLILEDGSEGPVQAMEYESSGAAYIFAAVTLPICLLYGWRAGASTTESLLLWFLLGTITYSKDFAYIRIPGLPLFVTDIVLASSLWILLRRWGTKFLRKGQWWGRCILLFIAMGIVSAVRGVVSREDTLLIFRDFAIVVYPLFVLVGFHVFEEWAALRRVFTISCIGSLLLTLNALAWFVAQPDQRRFVAFGVCLLGTSIAVVVLTLNGLMKPALGWPMAAFFSAGLLLTNARTIFVALAAALGITTLLSPTGRIRLSARSLRLMVAVASVCILLFLAASQTKSGADFLDRVGTELVSGTVDYAQDPNATFRFFAWMEALRRFSDQPLWGEGFGVPFIFEFADSDPRPHNTYLTVLYKMGILGFVPLFVLLCFFYWKGWKTIRRSISGTASIYLYTALLSHIVISMFGALNLLLESPFLASVYWLLCGLGIRAMYLVDLESHAIVAGPRVETPHANL